MKREFEKRRKGAKIQKSIADDATQHANNVTRLQVHNENVRKREYEVQKSRYQQQQEHVRLEKGAVEATCAQVAGSRAQVAAQESALRKGFFAPTGHFVPWTGTPPSNCGHVLVEAFGSIQSACESGNYQAAFQKRPSGRCCVDTEWKTLLEQSRCADQDALWLKCKKATDCVVENAVLFARSREAGTYIGTVAEEIRNFLHPRLWAASAPWAEETACGGYKRVFRMTSFAKRGIDGHKMPSVLMDALQDFGQLVVLVTKHVTNTGELQGRRSILREIAATAKAATINVRVSVIASTTFRMSTGDQMAVARCRGDVAFQAKKTENYLVLVLPWCNTLHGALREGVEIEKLFEQYELAIMRASAAGLCLCDIKPGNLLLRHHVGSMPSVFVADFDREHMLECRNMPSATLMLIHNVLMFLHVAAEGQSMTAAANSVFRSRWCAQLSARIAQLWMYNEQLAEGNSCVAELMLERFSCMCIEEGPGRSVAKTIATKLQTMLDAYFVRLARYSGTEIGVKVERAFAQEQQIVATLVAISVPSLAEVWLKEKIAT